MSYLGKMPMQRFTVREISPGINYGEPEKPLHWHWSVKATSAAAAESIIRNARTGGRSQTVVPPLG